MPDEFVESDPEAPPPWLVNTYKALSDERRLRILRRLREEDSTLESLTEMLELSKSTVHHHISILRGAGLVRVSVPIEEGRKHKSRTYSLRDKALGDATGLLDSYLEPREREERHA
jgi:DNA-binding transcriptional ArsR family regulator